MDEITQIGISVEMRDKAKIHIVKLKDKYKTMIDFTTIAVQKQIEADENDTDTKSTH